MVGATFHNPALESASPKKMHILGWLFTKSSIRQGAASQADIWFWSYSLIQDFPKEQLPRNACIWGVTSRIHHFLRATAIEKHASIRGATHQSHAWPQSSPPSNVCPRIFFQAKINQEVASNEPKQQEVRQKTSKTIKVSPQSAPYQETTKNQQKINQAQLRIIEKILTSINRSCTIAPC